MSRVSFILSDGQSRDEVAALSASAPQGTYVEFIEDEALRTDDQNRKMWPMLSEIAKQIDWPRGSGMKLQPNDFKLILMDALGHEMRLVPNARMTGYINLGRSTSRLKKREFSDLIELIYAFGAQQGVKFREPKEQAMRRIFGDPAPKKSAREPAEEGV